MHVKVGRLSLHVWGGKRSLGSHSGNSLMFARAKVLSISVAPVLNLQVFPKQQYRLS